VVRPIQSFRRNIARAQGQFKVHAVLHGKRGKPTREVSDVLRGALTLAVFSAVLLIAATSPAQTFKTIYNFCSKAGCTDGGVPYEMALVQGANGDLYGTTGDYGANGYGTVFKITTAGKLTTIYNFRSQASCLDGQYPEAGLIQASNGNFYGTTNIGGAYSGAPCLKSPRRGRSRLCIAFAQ